MATGKRMQRLLVRLRQSPKRGPRVFSAWTGASLPLLEASASQGWPLSWCWLPCSALNCGFRAAVAEHASVQEGHSRPFTALPRRSCCRAAHVRGWCSVSHGDLFRRADPDAFERLITTDTSLRHPQNLQECSLTCSAIHHPHDRPWQDEALRVDPKARVPASQTRKRD